VTEKKDKNGALQITVFGVVQGVGFRPFIFRLAERFSCHGWVKNIGYGVQIHIEPKKKSDGRRFLRALQEEKPPLALIEEVASRPAAYRGYRAFRIKKSKEGESFVFISPDISTCPDCRQEIMDPRERRFHYPFANCTDCGPRYTIVRSLPYDRAKTTMSGFTMCVDCRREYENPRDRRFHAQPITCPACGPDLVLKNAKTRKRIGKEIGEAVRLIKKGKILAVKGLGGFHLVCDPHNERAVKRLRRIKERDRKPLALMARDMEIIDEFAHFNPAERHELQSVSRPIVLLRKKRDIPGIAPHLDEIGFMLPYTPLHHLLLEDLGLVVATSSNKKDAPIAKDEKEGLYELCDYILTHNRPIQTRADDSVLKVETGKPLFLRRARGFVPYPQRVPQELRIPEHILALGGELKDTISIYKNGYVITSQFLGDLDEYQNYRYFEETIGHLKRLFDIRPQVIVSDLHPNFHSTRYASKSGLPHLRVQHHFAHILAVLLEHGVSLGTKVMGVSLDGYGYGEDGSAWGGEFLLADYSGFKRVAHLKPVPLPGGDLAAKQPWRMALSYLRDAFGEKLPLVRPLERVSSQARDLVLRMMESGLNSPPSSSCGRLFDAVSFLSGLAPAEVEFEAEAPMRLEAAAHDRTKTSYRFALLDDDIPWQISFAEAIQEITSDIRELVSAARIATKFHNTLAQAIAAVAKRTRDEFETNIIVLAGGVFLNRKLLSSVSILLERKGFQVLRPVRYSPNDESISLGQIAYALANLKKKS
jgi:hydrogenase maturation protein HypF